MASNLLSMTPEPKEISRGDTEVDLEIEVTNSEQVKLKFIVRARNSAALELVEDGEVVDNMSWEKSVKAGSQTVAKTVTVRRRGANQTGAYLSVEMLEPDDAGPGLKTSCLLRFR